MRRRLLWRWGFTVTTCACLLASSPGSAARATEHPAKIWAGVGIVDGRPAESPTRAAAPMRTPPPADVAGRWIGTWSGVDGDIQRNGTVIAELTQTGDTGWGKLVLHDANACDVVPRVLRQAGGAGVPVVFGVLGSRVVVMHELGSGVLAADLQVRGDQLVGRFRDTAPAVRLVLSRADAAARAAADARALTR